MNNKILQILTALILLCSATFAHGNDTTSYTYQGEVAGVVCSACSNHVKQALGTIKGVTGVKILRAEKEGAPARLEVVSTSSSLTREMAVKALGDQAKYYDIRSLAIMSPK